MRRPDPPAAPASEPPVTRPRGRNALIFLAGAAGFSLYVWVVVVLADHVIPLHWLAELVYYTAAGLAWTWPAAKLLRWALTPARAAG